MSWTLLVQDKVSKLYYAVKFLENNSEEKENRAKIEIEINERVNQFKDKYFVKILFSFTHEITNILTGQLEQ